MLHRITLCFGLLCANQAFAITLTSAQSDYTTTSDITTTANNTGGAGINSTQVGTFSAPRKIKNIHTISTSGSSAYGIRTTGNYNQITNQGTIITTNNTARGISIGGDFSTVNNSGTINTSGSSSYGIYASAGSNSAASASNYSTITNSGTVNAADAHGIYVNDNYTQLTNSGTITGGDDSSDYGARLDGANSILNNYGTISGTKYAIYNDGNGSVINNYGPLIGGVRIGGGTFNIYSGSISGEVDGSDVGDLNIFHDFTQNAAFSSLNNFTIASGTFVANDKIDAANITLNSGAILQLNSTASISGELSGDGTLSIANGAKFTPENDVILGNILVGGTLDLSKNNNLTLTTNLAGSGSAIIDLGINDQKILGNFALNSGDTLRISGNNNGFGSLDVSGSAAVSQNAQLIISSANKYLNSGQKIILLSSGDGSALNNFSTISVNNCRANACGLLRLNTEISDNNLVLIVDHASADELVVNNNAKKIYENLSKNNNNGKAQDFLNYLDSKDFSDAELQSTLTQLAPQSGKARTLGNVNVVGNSLKTSEMRLDKIRAGLDELPAHGATNFAQIFSANRQLDAFNLQQQGGALKSGFWVQPFGGSALQQSTPEDVGYKTILSGVSFGIDHEFSPKNTSGVALSVARSETKSLDSLKKTSALTYQFNIYNSHNFKKFFLDSFGGIAVSQYSSERAISVVATTAKANYSGFSYIAKFRGGTTHKINRELNFIPEISVSYLQGQVGKYSEKGADSLDLNVSATNSTTLEGRVGAALSWSKKIRESAEFKKFVTVLRSSYGYNFINSADDVVSSFSGQNSTFNSQVSPLDPGSFRIGAEINAYHVEDTIFSIDYQFEKRVTYQSHFVALKVLQEF